MKKVYVEFDACLEVYIDDDVPEEKAKSTATNIALEQIMRLDETEYGAQDPNLYLTWLNVSATGCEEVDCE